MILFYRALPCPFSRSRAAAFFSGTLRGCADIACAPPAEYAARFDEFVRGAMAS